MANNPWNVHEVSMFLKYCCPECDYQITQLDIFEDHATSSHELSKILFENIDKFVETKNGFQIKEEVNDMSEHNDYDIESNNCEGKLKTNLKEEANEHMLEEFDCNFCDYKTNQKSHLNAHLKKQHNELPFNCTLCDWKTDQNCNLNLHLFKQHGEYSNPCHICDFKTYQPTKLDNHLLYKHGISKFTGDFACHICDYKTDQSSSLNNHLLKLHDIHSNPCHICDFKTHQPSKLAEHLLEEHGISKYSGHLACHLCHYKTDQSHHLNKHILKHHGEYSNPCHICDFKTHLPTKLTEHLYKEHDISRFSGDFACHLCDFKTDSRTNINKHVTKLHNEFSEYAYSCHFCEFKSNLKTELKKHALDLHNISNYVCDPPNKSDGKKHLCHLCDFQADLHRNLTRHLKLTHGENMSKGRGKEGSKCCHICDFRTNYRSGLRSHVATMHGEDELKKISIYSKANISYTKDENGFNVCPFPLCDYKSKETGNLKRHYARIHKNIELDKLAPKLKEDKDSKKCHLCEFSSKFNSNLRNHIVRSHGKSELNGSSKQVGVQTSQNEPENSQEGCPEKYDVNPLIKVECEIEETDSLLKCDKCDKSFPTKYDLNNHKKENHGYGIDWQSDGLCPHCGEVSCKTWIRNHNSVELDDS